MTTHSKDHWGSAWGSRAAMEGLFSRKGPTAWEQLQCCWRGWGAGQGNAAWAVVLVLLLAACTPQPLAPWAPHPLPPLPVHQRRPQSCACTVSRILPRPDPSLQPLLLLKPQTLERASGPLSASFLPHLPSCCMISWYLSETSRWCHLLLESLDCPGPWCDCRFQWAALAPPVLLLCPTRGCSGQVGRALRPHLVHPFCPAVTESTHLRPLPSSNKQDGAGVHSAQGVLCRICSCVFCVLVHMCVPVSGGGGSLLSPRGPWAIVSRGRAWEPGCLQAAASAQSSATWTAAHRPPPSAPLHLWASSARSVLTPLLCRVGPPIEDHLRFLSGCRQALKRENTAESKCCPLWDSRAVIL